MSLGVGLERRRRRRQRRRKKEIKKERNKERKKIGRVRRSAMGKERRGKLVTRKA